MNPIRILLIEDNPSDAELLELMLAQVTGVAFALERAEMLGDGLKRLAAGGIDVVLLDLSLPDSFGLETFLRVKAQAPSVPVVVLSGHDDEALGVRVVRESAQDYWVKGQVTSQIVARGLRYAMERKQAELALHRAAETERAARVAVQQAHAELQRTQSQLIQSAKLASLGQLVAGVAHEINNPLAFVVNNMVVLQRDFQALRELVQLYQQADAGLAQQQPELHQRIQQGAEAMDVAYTLGNLDGVVARSRDGLRRIQEIVQDLRGFARASLHGDAQQGVDMNDAIASTLNLIRGLANGRKVELHYEPSLLLPNVGYSAKMNQVVLSLVTNAVDACAAGGKVTVRTAPVAGGVEIAISDNGCGISPAIRDQIFDPFFTTKPQGDGVGLGLSISHGIVCEYGGRIDVESKPGQGSTFTVFLPVKAAS